MPKSSHSFLTEGTLLSETVGRGAEAMGRQQLIRYGEVREKAAV
jgi:hypothetical protein